MDSQNTIVAFVVLLAVTYVGLLLYKKLKSFTAKGSCGVNCGCGNGSVKTQKSFVRIGKNRL